MLTITRSQKPIRVELVEVVRLCEPPKNYNCTEDFTILYSVKNEVSPYFSEN